MSEQEIQRKSEEQVAKPFATKKAASGKLAVVLVRGLVGIKRPIRETLKLMRLVHVNNVVVIENNEITQGMLRKVKDYVTWGEINDKTFGELVAKRGVEYKGRSGDTKGKYNYNLYFEHSGKKYNKVFRLNPPRKGFGKKGIKWSFNKGGALGYRAEKINGLIMRMI